MTTQTEKLTKKQTEKLIGVNDLHELGTKVERHSSRLTIEKMATRLIPMEGGNAFYAYSVKIADTETGDFWMTATAKDAHEFIDGIIADAVFRGRRFFYNGMICKVVFGTIVDGVDYQDVEFDGESAMIKSATLLTDIATGEIVLA